MHFGSCCLSNVAFFISWRREVDKDIALLVYCVINSQEEVVMCGTKWVVVVDAVGMR